MNNFPDHDFKIDCGDDPAVRQWLHDNGVKTISGKSPVDAHEKDKYFFLRIHSMRCVHGSSEYYFREHNGWHINPYDYMQEQTVAERMAALIEEYKHKDWVNFIAISDGGYIWLYSERPEERDGMFYQNNGRSCSISIIEDDNDREFLAEHWRETLTELPTVKRELMIAPDHPVDTNKTIDNRAEIAARDERECTPKEAQVMAQVAASEVQPAPKPLTIPSICLADHGFQMMLGGEHGGRCGE